MAEQLGPKSPAMTVPVGFAGRSAGSETRSITEGEDGIRNLKATQAVEAAFLAQGFATPPGDVSAIITNQVRSAIKDLPTSQVANMTPGSGVLSAAATAAVEQFIGMLNPAQREAAKVGVNPLDPATMLKLGAALNQLPNGGGFGHMARDSGDIPASSARYEGINGLALSLSERLTHNYAIQQGVLWAADNRDILKLGPAAIDVLKQTQLRKDTYEGLTKDAHLSAKGALGVSKMAHERGEDANEAGKEIKDSLVTMDDKKVTQSVDNCGKTAMDPKATPEQKEAAKKDVESKVDEHLNAHPEHKAQGDKLKERMGVSVQKNEAQAAATAKTEVKATTAKKSTQAKMDAF